jgi:hypothetical protein
MTERTTVRLPEDLLARARRKAAAEGRTLTSLIEDGLRSVVSEKRGARRAKRVLPPVSTATGGPAPGFEHITLSKIAELDDLLYAERLKNGFR